MEDENDVIAMTFLRSVIGSEDSRKQSVREPGIYLQHKIIIRSPLRHFEGTQQALSEFEPPAQGQGNHCSDLETRTERERL